MIIKAIKKFFKKVVQEADLVNYRMNKPVRISADTEKKLESIIQELRETGNADTAGKCD